MTKSRCVERINLTIRTSLARFIRKGIKFSKTMKMHQKTFDFFQAWYNFIKPHDSLKLNVTIQPIKTCLLILIPTKTRKPKLTYEQ
ncbi:MAG TPA: hypothetical protein GXX65_08725 [Methanosarcina sp.]|nr:hypothetical protein [Methanosarcina sp.]